MKTDHFTLLTCSPIVDNNSTRQQEGNKYNLDFFCKKLAHAYFERRIFSKSFGGKFRHI